MKLLGAAGRDEFAVLGCDRHRFSHARLTPEVEHLARVRLLLAAVHRQPTGSVRAANARKTPPASISGSS
jgi:hypothetical protein